MALLNSDKNDKRTQNAERIADDIARGNLEASAKAGSANAGSKRAATYWAVSWQIMKKNRVGMVSASSSSSSPSQSWLRCSRPTILMPRRSRTCSGHLLQHILSEPMSMAATSCPVSSMAAASRFPSASSPSSSQRSSASLPVSAQDTSEALWMP